MLLPPVIVHTCQEKLLPKEPNPVVHYSVLSALQWEDEVLGYSGCYVPRVPKTRADA